MGLFDFDLGFSWDAPGGFAPTTFDLGVSPSLDIGPWTTPSWSWLPPTTPMGAWWSTPSIPSLSAPQFFQLSPAVEPKMEVVRPAWELSRGRESRFGEEEYATTQRRGGLEQERWGGGRRGESSGINWSNLLMAGLPVAAAGLSFLLNRGGDDRPVIPPPPQPTANEDFLRAQQEMMRAWQEQMAAMMAGLGAMGAPAPPALPPPSSNLPSEQIQSSLRSYLARRQAQGLTTIPDAATVAAELGITVAEAEAALQALRGSSQGLLTGATIGELTGDYGTGTELAKIMAFLQNRGLNEELARRVYDAIGSQYATMYSMLQQTGADPAAVAAWLASHGY